jgi:undecaprenyl-diphosphatase
MSIPAVIGSALVTLISAVKTGIDWSNIPAYLVGMVVACISGYFALALLKKIVAANSFGKFAYYCWGVGILSLILSLVL